jgi:hypothetical protein
MVIKKGSVDGSGLSVSLQDEKEPKIQQVLIKKMNLA